MNYFNKYIITNHLKKISLSSLLLAGISGFAVAQNKSLAQIQYEAMYGPIQEEKAENKPKGKYDHLTPDQKQRFEEIDKQNAALLAKRPQDYIKQHQPTGIVADPNSGVFTQTVPQQNILNAPSSHLHQGAPNGSYPQYKTSFGAMRHRKISDLVTSWSGKEGQYILWNYSKDYSIYNASSFNNEAKLNEALGLDDAINKIFRYIGAKEAANPRHLPPKICYEGTTIMIVDTNVECE